MATMRVREPFACSIAGVERVYRPGDLVNAKDPVVKGREQFFEAPEAAADRRADIETATAAPGQRRSVSPAPAKKTAAAEAAE